jgi:hypothetical protein
VPLAAPSGNVPPNTPKTNRSGCTSTTRPGSPPTRHGRHALHDWPTAVDHLTVGLDTLNNVRARLARVPAPDITMALFTRMNPAARIFMQAGLPHPVRPVHLRR